MSANPGNRGHVLFLPYLAKSHQRAFTALAQRLAQRSSFQITMVSTPLNVKSIRELLPADTAIAFAELPFSPEDHGLPPGVEHTNCAPPHHIIDLMRASASLQPAMEELVANITRLEGRPPVAIVGDFLLSWSLEVARKFGSMHYSFLVISAFAMLEIMQSRSSPELNDDPLFNFLSRLDSYSRQSDGVVANTMEALEQEGLEKLRGTWKRVWAVGPLICTPPPSPPSSSPELKWLDRHPPASVLYISFGSEVRVHPRQMMEMAKGVEASGTAFIWVIRPPIGIDAVEEEGLEEVEWLPEGFCRRVKESHRGLLLTKWAPQLEILSHEAVGAFLSHCGWNSLLESLSKGVPIIGWPLAYEQPDNLKYLEGEPGVAVELAVGVEAHFSGSDVERVIGVVMGDESEKGAEMRRKAKDMKEIMKKATMHDAMDEFIQELDSVMASSPASHS